jgi:hypothetical protein
MTIFAIEPWPASGGKSALTTKAKHLAEKAKTRRRAARFSEYFRYQNDQSLS